ncbi:Endonuclease/exonuclease/phosphatase family protein [Desulfonema magnum]|uniref:Endonuclease/exonuclease/phosphatase family protein n=1 Tax=Desulfonema magnum TaxID=45655 RepID=A0A975BMY8_9BACT|nr:Endonuclease/exonuclease/phosphatase family protein [Desulfonema magnum]
MLKVRANFSYARLDPSSIKILNWNVYKGRKTNWENDFLKLSRKQDIILIQEAYLNKNMTDVLDVRRMEWNFAPGFIYRRKNIPTGVLTASKTQSLTSDFLKTRYHEPIVRSPKVSLFTQYHVSGSTKTLLVINVHGINFVRLNAFKSQLDDLEKTLEDHTGPMILAGDFNTWKKKRLRLLMAMTGRLGLNAIHFTPDYRKTMFGYPLDHIFFKGLRVRKYSVLRNIASSDHKPMVAEFVLENKHKIGN